MVRLRTGVMLGLTFAFFVEGAASNMAHAQAPEILQGATGPFLREVARIYFDDATLQSAPDGAPVVVVRQGQRTFLFGGQECRRETRGPVCDMATFGFLFQGPYDYRALIDVNAFNRSVLKGKAFLDRERDLTLQYSFGAQGVTAEFISANILSFRDVIAPMFVDRVVVPAARFRGLGRTSAFDEALTGEAIDVARDPVWSAWKEILIRAMDAPARADTRHERLRDLILQETERPDDPAL